MGHTVESIDISTRKLIFDFKEEEVRAFGFESRIESSLRSKQKNFELKGFRKGKAPLGMIKKIYGREAELDIFQDFMSKKIHDVAEKELWDIVEILPVDGLQYKKGESLSFNITVRIVPVIELKDFSGQAFTRIDSKANEQDFKDFERTWMQSRGEMREVVDEEAALEGESRYGIFDFKGTREDGTIEIVETEHWFVSDTKKEEIPGFKENVSGMKKNEKRSFEALMPEDYSREELRGVKLLFDVELQEIKEYVVPELDDEFAKESGFGSVDEMRKLFREDVARRKEQEAEEKLRNDIEKWLLGENPFEPPEKIIVYHEEEARKHVKKKFAELGWDTKRIKAFLEANEKDVREKSILSSRQFLLYHSLAKKYGVEISEGESTGSVKDRVFERILEDVTVRQE